MKKKKSEKNGMRHVPLFVAIVLSLTLAGCKGDSSASPSHLARTPVGIEDYYEMPIMETEKGYYYNAASEEGGLLLHYLDKATGKDILLCSKPECKHDGNEYCVATNRKYHPISFQLYDGAIYMAAICDGESSYDFKLVRIALDGTSMSDVATYFSTNLISNNHPSKYREEDYMLIHRGKALFQVCVGGNDEVDEVRYRGTFLYDLNSGEVTCFHPEGVSQDFSAWEAPTARGDSFYYFVKPERKKILHRLHLPDQTDEELELLPNFSGAYVVLNDGTIFYMNSLHSKLCMRRPDGTNEDLGKITQTIRAVLIESSVPDFLSPDWFPAEHEITRQSEPRFLSTDGESVFVFTGRYFRDASDYEFTLPEGKDDLLSYYDEETLLHISDFDFETRIGKCYAWYATPKGCFLFTQFDSRGNKIRDLQIPVITESFEEYQDYRPNTLNAYFTKDKVLFQLMMIEPKDPENPNGNDESFIFVDVEETIAEFLEEVAFPKPFWTAKHLWHRPEVNYITGYSYEY